MGRALRGFFIDEESENHDRSQDAKTLNISLTKGSRSDMTVSEATKKTARMKKSGLMVMLLGAIQLTMFSVLFIYDVGNSSRQHFFLKWAIRCKTSP